MKLRLFGDSIRLRLTQAEVEILANGGELEAVFPFPGEALGCSVQPSDGPLDAHHAAGRITILVPFPATSAWAASTDVGMYATTTALSIAVEKDYTCIHKPDSPDNVGTYPNPLGV